MAIADATYGLAASCADARYCWPVATADWTVEETPLAALLVAVVLGTYDYKQQVSKIIRARGRD